MGNITFNPRNELEDIDLTEYRTAYIVSFIFYIMTVLSFLYFKYGKYLKNRKYDDGEENDLGIFLSLVISFVMIVILFIISFKMNSIVDKWYNNGYTLTSFVFLIILIMITTKHLKDKKVV